ncbi:hypothetical protein NMC96_08890 [Citrobacter portucalensis]|uniref:hypothetical protein n=1 Tax=Citrobacter portucalensis TaxID=1639133 RepID=UPI00351D75FC
MDWLTFLSKVIETCTWPGLIIFIVYKYKGGLLRLLDSLTSLKVGEYVNATFSKDTANVAKDSEKELPQEKSSKQLTLEDKLLELPPRLAILDAWKIVEEAVSDSIDTHKLMPTITMKEIIIRRDPGKLARVLKQGGYLTAAQTELLNRLRNLRNEVVHAPYGLEPSKVDSENYVKSAMSFVNLLNEEPLSETS